jgi:hypothetical protein
MNIKPGLPVKIVLDVDHIREKSDVRNSIIFDINENMLIMAQTEPLILKSSINKTVLLTYLARENRNVVRYGFDADIFDLIMDYELSVDNKTKAIILIKKTDPVQHNLRFFFRI